MADWKCGANPYAVVPSDCNWPGCGCDPHVDRVLHGLREGGWIIIPPDWEFKHRELAERVFETLSPPASQ